VAVAATAAAPFRAQVAPAAHTAAAPPVAARVSRAVRSRPELQGGVERNAVLLYNGSGPNEEPTAPGEQVEADGEAPLEDLGSSLGRAVHRR
jgi:hypothetical protein